MQLRGIVFLLMILAAGGPLLSAGQQMAKAGPSLGEQANAAFAARDWAGSARLHEQMVQTMPSPRAWYRLGISRNKLGQSEKALESFEKGMKAGLPPRMGELGMAMVYGRKKDKEKAFEYLQKAAAHGLNTPEQMENEEDLAELRSDARFAPLLEQARRNQKPCAHKAENRQFDFWVGKWDVVTTTEEMPTGQSRVELILGDCVLQENWKGDGTSYSGKSYNIYNSALNRWEQYWVDNAGDNIFFYGGLKDGVMDYWTDELPQPDGTKLKRHLQFFNLGPNRVRQFSQGSTDGGKTWQVEYDFTYNRAE